MSLRNLSEAAAIVSALLASDWAANVTGKRTATFSTQVGEQKYTWDLVADGSKLTGKSTSTNSSGEITEGKVDGDTLSRVENLNFRDVPLRIRHKAVLSGDQLKIRRNVADIATEEAVAKRTS